MIYLYYPFNDSSGTDILDGLVRGVGNRITPQIHSSPKIGELCCDNGTCPNGFWNVTDNDEIYIIGHSYSGFKILGDNDKNILIDQTEIVNRLHLCGLSKTPACKIILYACFSAKTLDNKAGLAAHLASALKKDDYACWDNVWGYTRTVRMRAKKDKLNNEYKLYLKVQKNDWQPIEYVSQYYFKKVAPHK